MVPVLPALRQLLVEEGHKLGRGAPSGAGWTAQKASFHRHWLPQKPTAHLASGWGQEGPARTVISEPAFHGLAVEQPPPSVQCLSAALPEFFANFFLFIG